MGCEMTFEEWFRETNSLPPHVAAYSRDTAMAALKNAMGQVEILRDVVRQIDEHSAKLYAAREAWEASRHDPR